MIIKHIWTKCEKQRTFSFWHCIC